MDLSSLRSVRDFAERELATDRPIDALINNAGIMAPRERLVSKEGFELQFATNVLGHFLLTGMLLPLTLRATAPRVVTVASLAHRLGGPVPLTDQRYTWWSQSSLSCLLVVPAFWQSYSPTS